MLFECQPQQPASSGCGSVEREGGGVVSGGGRGDGLNSFFEGQSTALFFCP